MGPLSTDMSNIVKFLEGIPVVRLDRSLKRLVIPGKPVNSVAPNWFIIRSRHWCILEVLSVRWHPWDDNEIRNQDPRQKTEMPGHAMWHQGHHEQNVAWHGSSPDGEYHAGPMLKILTWGSFTSFISGLPRCFYSLIWSYFVGDSMWKLHPHVPWKVQPSQAKPLIQHVEKTPLNPSVSEKKKARFPLFCL